MIVFNLYSLFIIAGILFQSFTTGTAQKQCTWGGYTTCCDSCCQYECCGETYSDSSCNNSSVTLILILCTVLIFILVLVVCIFRCYICAQRLNDLSQPEVVSVRRTIRVRVGVNQQSTSSSAPRVKDEYDPPPSYGSVIRSQY